MMKVMSSMQGLLNQQYRRPSGLVGRLIGEKMVNQHEPEVQWGMSLLALTPMERVLEIGCGAGRALELALPLVPEGHVTGIDYSATMIKASRRRNAQAVAEGRLELLQAEVSHLPCTASQFDAIWSIHTTYFWPDPRQALAELDRVLKPAGRLVLIFSPGKVGEDEKNGVLARVEEQFLATLRQSGYTASLKQGPDSRQYQTVAIMARKEVG